MAAMNVPPKLLPVWPNAAEHALADLVDFSVGAKYHPDFGGAGVDIEVNQEGVSHCVALKCHDSRQNKLSALYLTLPLTAPNEVRCVVEPCLEYQLDLNQRIRTFESTIRHYRGIVKRKGAFSAAVQEMTKILKSKKARNQLKDVNQSLLELMQAQPESFCSRECNWDYTGGCLAALHHGLSDGSSSLLAHPSGWDLSKLVISEYVSSYQRSKEPLLQKTASVVLKPPSSDHGTIFQVSLQKVQKETSCCVRFKNRCQYIHLFDTLATDPVVLSEYAYDDRLCYVAASNYIFGELVAVTETGHILLQHCDRTEPSWKTSVSHERPSSNQWWCANFGSHPRHIGYMDRTALYSLDARREGSRRHLFCNVQHEAFLKDEFVLFKPNPLNCHQVYLASSKLLSVWDERHSRQPMLTWSHSMQHSPSFLEFTPFQSHEDGSNRELYVTLGSQRSRQVAVFHVHQDSSAVQPLSMVPPWQLSRPSDFTKHLEHQGCPVDDRVLRRVRAPLVGGCMVGCKGGGFSALQLTSYGDVFHQDFVWDGGEPLCSGNWNFSAGCRLLPAQEITEAVGWWTELVVAAEPEAEKNGGEHPLIVRHYTDYNGVAPDVSTGELPEHNRSQLAVLQNVVVKAMKENKVLTPGEWKQTLKAIGARGSEDSDVDGIVNTLEAVHLGTWDRTARRYLEQWTTETARCPVDFREGNEGAEASFMGTSEHWERQEPQHQPESSQPTSFQGELVSRPSPEVRHPDFGAALPSQSSVSEYFDASQPLFVDDGDNDVVCLSQTSMTEQPDRLRREKQPLKKKRVSAEGF